MAEAVRAQTQRREKGQQQRQIQRSAVRNVLLGVSRSFGAQGEALQRRLAARLWRQLPRDISPEEAWELVQERLETWAGSVIGEPVRFSCFRAAFLHSGLSPDVLLEDDGKHGKHGMLRASLAGKLPRACPAHESPLSMPLQDLGSVPFAQVCLAAVWPDPHPASASASVRLL